LAGERNYRYSGHHYRVWGDRGAEDQLGKHTKTILQYQISSLMCNNEINYIYNNPDNQTLQHNINNQPSANSMSFSPPVSSPDASSLHSISSIPQHSSVSLSSTMLQLSYQDMS